MRTPRTLVMGCGGIGGVVSAHLVSAGLEVTTVSRNGEMRAAIAERGLRVIGVGAREQIPVSVVEEVPEGPFDLVILATQPTDVEGAMAQAVGALAPDGRALVLQNGLCEERVAAVLGDRGRVIGGVVSWGAAVVEPGVVEQTSKGGFTLGTLSGQPVPEGLGLERYLGSIGDVGVTANLLGARWSKLIINSVVSSLGTLNGSRLGPVVRSRIARRVGLEIMTEGVAVAQGAGVQLEMVAGTLDLQKIALSDSDRRGGSPSLMMKHTLLLAVGMKYRRLYSSLLRAIEAGKPPAIDFLNGELVSWADRLGVEAPMNRAVCERVYAFAEGRLSPGPGVISDLAANFRGGA